MSEEELKALKDHIKTTKNNIFATFKVENISNLIIYYEDLQQRIDKAIELINNIYFGNFFSDLKPIKLADSKEVKEIISILKGEYK